MRLLVPLMMTPEFVLLAIRFDVVTLLAPSTLTPFN